MTPDWSATLRTIVLTEVYQAAHVPFTTLLSCGNVLKLPNPVNMNQTRMRCLDSSWFVTYKADGTRCLWVSAVYMGMHFVLTLNRCCEMEILSSSPSDHPAGIIYALDCEAVEGSLICHDILISERVPVLFRAFAKRLKLLYMLRSYPELPQPKSFFPCGQVNMVPGIRDGLIFVHSQDKFQTGKTDTIIKWKPLNEISVDLLVTKDLEVLMSSGGKLIPFARSIVEYKLLLSECCEHIVEFNFAEGAWYPCSIRADKSTPNDAFVVKETEESVLQPIHKEALFRVCLQIP